MYFVHVRKSRILVLSYSKRIVTMSHPSRLLREEQSTWCNIVVFVDLNSPFYISIAIVCTVLRGSILFVFGKENRLGSFAQ